MSLSSAASETSSARDAGSGAPRPTWTRYKVVALTLLLGAITYLDRVCISKLAPEMMADLSLSKIQMGYAFSAFALAYAVFGVPAAWWADRLGARKLLAAIVVWWSLCTLGTAAAIGLSSLLLIRFLFGAGEAGAWPCVARTFSRWIPVKDRGTIQGLFFTGAHLSGGLTPLLVTGLLGFMSWRMVFAGFGLLGFIWALAWYFWFRDDPAEHQSVNSAEVRLITADRPAISLPQKSSGFWKTLLCHPNMFALCVMYFPNSFVFYFCITWLPTYLKEQHGFDAAALGFLAGLPLMMSVFGDLMGGLVTDFISARLGLRAGRSGLGVAAYLVAGTSLLCAPLVHNPIMVAILIAVAVAASMFTLGAAWGTCLDIAGSNAGVVSATMNTAGQIGSLLCPLLVAYTLKWFSSWNISLYVMGILFLVGMAAWAMIDPRKRIFDT